MPKEILIVSICNEEALRSNWKRAVSLLVTQQNKGEMRGHAVACPRAGTVLEEQLEAELKLPFVDAFTCQAADPVNSHE